MEETVFDAQHGVNYNRPAATPFSTADFHAPAANTIAAITYPAAAGKRHFLSGIAFSYSGGLPTGGSLVILVGGAIVFSLDIIEEGENIISFNPIQFGTEGSALAIQLAAGGVGISGKVNALGHWEG